MAIRKYESAERAMTVAKEAMWLAWQACGGTSGMGFFQDRGEQSKDAVWDQAYFRRDYSGVRHGPVDEVDADYVFGRMLKLRFSVAGDSIKVPDHEPRRDYQGWCGKYKTYAALFDAAEAQPAGTDAKQELRSATK